MAVIQEDEAKRYPDLHNFENDCFDFLRAMKHLRQGNTNYTPEDAIEPAKEMQAFLERSLVALVKGQAQ